ncbi:7TM diverse intracellular signaling domain-containing protein [Marinobacter persicus]|uniref:7TM diverse intracellular signaling domain-containing protein n=1 Tax=Marinobacter persicus TaxID=930118 RepID=UPI0015A55B19|nr:7TM diverse intracellular signaling domain-containing protein [Marinobacter persicus]
MSRRLLSLGLLWVLLICWTPALAQVGSAPPVLAGEHDRFDASSRVAIYRNAGDGLSVAQARDLFLQGRFETPGAGAGTPTNFGLTTDQIWLALDFTTADKLPDRWFLEIGHASLDHVEVHLFRDGEQIFEGESGDLLPFVSKPVEHRNHVFPLALESDEQYQLFVGVRSEGTLTIPVTFWQGDSLWANDQQSYTVLSLYYGVLLALLVYNLFLFFSLRDRLYLTYVGFMACLAVGQAGLSGFTGQFLWPETPWLTHLSPTGGVSAAGVFGALFVHRFLGGVPARLKLRWLMPTFSVVYGITFAVALAGFYHVAAISVNVTSLLFALSALFMGAVSLVHREPGAQFFVLAWAAFLVGVLVIALHNMGVLPSNALTTNAMLIGSVTEMLLLSLALADRINELQRSREHAQAQALENRQEMLEVVRENERQLESRVAERTRELEAANLKLRESSLLLEEQANHDSLTGLANRKLLHERLARARARARTRRSGASFALMVVDLNKFKQINDSFGHAAGDAVLIAVAKRLEALSRETDTVARIGGDEFVLLLEDVWAREDLGPLKRRLSELAEESIRLPDGRHIQVGLSLGEALYPDDAKDLDQLFSLADAAMYEHKNSGQEEASVWPS